MVYAKPAALQIDPIEKEPSFHMIPGTSIFCTATASCNFRGKFCHNWHLSQRGVDEIPYIQIRPEEVVNKAIERGCKTVSFTYSEPTVFYEYMLDIVNTESFYQEISSSMLEPVLHTLKTIKSYGRHLEIVNLVIPTLNDSPEGAVDWIFSFLLRGA